MQSTRIEMLPVPLTDTEKIARGEELAILLRDITSAEDAESERKKNAKVAIEALEAKAARLAQIVRSGQEHRPIEVETSWNVTQWTVESIRYDTREVFQTRPMSRDERARAQQGDLLARTEIVDLNWVEKGASPGMTEKPKAPRKPQTKFSEAAE